MEGQVNGWIGRLDCRNMRLHTLNTCFIIGLHCCHRPILWTHDRVLAVFCCHRPIPCTHDSTRATIRLKRRVVFASLPHYLISLLPQKKRMTSKVILCARNQSRTDTSFRTLPPESSASTNSAIRASFWDCKYTHFF